MGDVFDQVSQQIASGQNGQPSQPQSRSDVFDQVAAQQSASPQSAPNAGNEQAGQQTNDLGNTVIVPKDGESFADTMQRAAAFGKTATQSDINKEMASAPKKVAETLAAAPAIGAAGAGLLAVPGELSAVGSQTVNAARALLQSHPEAARVIGKMLLTGALGGDIGHSAKTAILGALLGGLIK
jgi:hypothetical protein